MLVATDAHITHVLFRMNCPDSRMSATPTREQVELTDHLRMLTKAITTAKPVKDFWTHFSRVAVVKGDEPFDFQLCKTFIGKNCHYDFLELAHNLGIWALGLEGPTIEGVGVDPQKVAFVVGREPVAGSSRTGYSSSL